MANHEGIGMHPVTRQGMLLTHTQKGPSGRAPCAYIGSLVAAHPEDGLLKCWVDRQRISGSSHVMRDYAIMADG